MTALTIFGASAAFAQTEGFDKVQPGGLPAGWECGVTGRGSPRWTVEPDKSAASAPNVLRQLGSGTFPWCVSKSTSIADGFVEVKFRSEKGREDQAGGVVWRWKDGDNYYVARANALENNVTIYRTIKGKRHSFRLVKTKVASGVWHTLRVDYFGNRFTVTFDGKKTIVASDRSFTEAGKVGLWTKADSVTLFDDFSYGTRPRQ